jgi:ribosomal protein L11 methyltransferase
MIEDLRHIIYNTVIEANRKLTPGEVEKAVAKANGIDRKTVRLAIKDLVGLGELTYTYLYGTSFLEKSLDKPVRVSKRIVIKPPDKVYQPEPGEVVVNIAGGAAFGSGAHPTTRLALRALDDTLASVHPEMHQTPSPAPPPPSPLPRGEGGPVSGQALVNDPCLRKDSALTGLDVGTGTGILAIALAKLGLQKVVGIDIDPCAVSEAIHNVLLNGLAQQVTITNTPLEELSTSFSVIVANIAYPTLRRLTLLLSEKTEQDGLLILSGFIRMPGSKDLVEAYTEHGLRLVREEIERGWVCLTLCKMGSGCI